MLRSVDDWEGEHFAFGGAPAQQQPSFVAIDNGVNGLTATIPDAHLLFTAQFARAGDNLLLHGEDGKSFVVQDYFATDDRARLLSPQGAALSAEVIAALAGPQAPGQYAQAAATPPAAQAVGRVVQSGGDATIVRNGVAIVANTGDAILKGDVLQTVSGSLGVTFNDGSTLNLTANTRLVVNEFVYDPRGSANSQLLDLVQGSLTFISGGVAHSGNMSIGTPVATMGIRGTVGGVTTASDGTVNFYVSQSATGAVILDSQGRIIANVVQDGPLIIVRPVGPLQVLAEEVQKSPAQLAIELAALQQIVSIQSVGQQIIQQYFQTDPNNPNPQSTDKPLTQIQLSIQPNQSPSSGDSGNGDGGPPPPATATVTVTTITPEGTGLPANDDPIIIVIPVDQPPLISGPLQLATNEDTALVFSLSNENSISVFDADTTVLTVTLTATNGVLTLNGVAGLTFSDGDGTGDETMTFSGTQAAINAALDGMSFVLDPDYNGEASISITSSDGTSTTATNTIPITVGAVNDAPVIAQPNSPMMSYTEGQPETSINAVLTLSDVDSATLSGAKVTISCNFNAGQDVLSFANQNGIAGSYDAQTGVLTLTGVASVAAYQAALRSVAYANSSDNPSDETRTISYQVDDGAAANNLSNVVTATIDVTPVNDPPVLDYFNVTVAEGGVTVLRSCDFHITDPDSSDFFFSVSDVTGGQFEVQSGESWVTAETGGFTVADIEAGNVRFVHDGGEAAPTFMVWASDGTEQGAGAPISPTVDFSNVNDAPVLAPTNPTLTGISASDTDNAGQSVAAFIGTSISDADTAALVGIAIVGAAFANGTWQYSTDDRVSWTNFGAYSYESALLLADTDYVRFVPGGQNGGSQTFNYVAWDQVSGTHGETASVTADDTSTFSSASDTAQLTVTATNNAPAFDQSEYDFSALENVAFGTVVGTVHAVDADNDTLSYSIVSGNDDQLFSIDSNGNIIVTGLLDYEDLAHHELVVATTDTGSLSDETTVHISIQDVSEPLSVSLTSTAGVTLFATQYGSMSGFIFPGAGNVTHEGTYEDRISLGYVISGAPIVRTSNPLNGEHDFTPVATAFYTDEDETSYFTSIMSDVNSVRLTQTIALGSDANYFETTIDIYNGGSFDLSNVRFLRNIDPDQDVDAHSNSYFAFTTYNDVIQNPTGSSAVAAVSAEGYYSGVAVVLVGADSDWRASSYSGLIHSDPYQSQAYDNPQDPNGAANDQAITLTNAIGTIAAGGHAKISFITTANVATSGANALVGTACADTIDGLGGNDLLFGLDGADNFVFRTGYGTGTVVDFSGHAGQGDVIELYSEFGSFGELYDNGHIQDIDRGGGVHDTLIGFGDGDSITLAHVNPSQLSDADFIFHQQFAIIG
ncbi:MAG: cadherin-like domain-containing protein [Pseudolabrys sp.]|nr:cadherin-like domain-containing protein [Pseudolabrys sp.]MDP2295912.1 cadherin-like domain-containing protein [Pseudolabrys sp.]